ncbi:MAG: DNA-binding protein [Desulfurococcales archaeon]|jgi:DNA-binding protein Alba|nr:hypothetical protein [Desulfurococcales archaeon]NAZ13101.1 DNA-binding protein [Desulfurococcales archaeon]
MDLIKMSEKFLTVVNGRFVSKYPMIIVGRESPMTYATEIILRLNQGVDRIILIGKGRNISKAAVIYNILRSKLRDAVNIDEITIGSIETQNRRLISYLAVIISRRS